MRLHKVSLIICLFLIPFSRLNIKNLTVYRLLKYVLMNSCKVFS
jgi:hypothetical protein